MCHNVLRVCQNVLKCMLKCVTGVLGVCHNVLRVYQVLQCVTVRIFRVC